MQQYSRLATTATRSYQSLFLLHNRALLRGFATEPTARPADPAVYSNREEEVDPASPHGDPEETKEKYEPDTGTRETETESGIEPMFTTRTAPPRPPNASSPRLEHVAVNNPAEPIVQQKRKNSTSTTLDEATCAGLDGSPWLKDESADSREQQVKRDNEDDITYFKHHKASPLSEIKIADTRKPITRETDGTVNEQDVLGVKDAAGWRPEQLDTAEEAFERANRIFRESAMRGDPDSPHGRVLRVLRGEWF